MGNITEPLQGAKPPKTRGLALICLLSPDIIPGKIALAQNINVRQISLYALPIHEIKKEVKLGDTFELMWTSIKPLDLSQDSTAILHADPLSACPDGSIVDKILCTLSITQS